MPSKTNKETALGKIQYRIAEIKQQNYFQYDYSKYSLNKSDIQSGIVVLNADIKIDENAGIISILLKTLFEAQKSNKSYKLFGVESIHNFQIRDFYKKFVRLNENDVKIPDTLLYTFLNISVSGTRGMLIALNNNPDYANIILPIVNPKNLLEEVKKLNTKKK